MLYNYRTMILTLDGYFVMEEFYDSVHEEYCFLIFFLAASSLVIITIFKVWKCFLFFSSWCGGALMSAL